MTKQPAFGDNARIRRTTLTEELGFAGQEGTVFGMTTPSVTGVKVLGSLTSDYAVNVHFPARNGGHWFAPELVEVIDHAPGTQMTIGHTMLVRRADGSWVPPPKEDAD